MFLFSQGCISGLIVLTSLAILYFLTALAIQKFPSSAPFTIFFILFVVSIFVANKSYLLQESPFRILFFSYLGLQVISHFIEVVWKGEKLLSFKNYLVANTFLCNIASGPIENPVHLASNIKNPEFSKIFVKQALILIISGLFKKGLADTIQAIQVSISENQWDSSSAILSSFLLLSRTYCDFSGYTDIARGAALLLGVDLSINFKNPYLATNILEYWSRWHISLSRWARVYVFYPLFLFLSRHSKFPEALIGFISIISVFLLVGMWHGINEKFLAWAILNTIFISLYMVSRNKLKWLPGAFGVFTTWIMVIYLQLIAHSFQSLKSNTQFMKLIFAGKFNNQYDLTAWSIAIALFMVPIFFDYVLNKPSGKINYVRWVIILEILILVALKSEGEPFIYGKY